MGSDSSKTPPTASTELQACKDIVQAVLSYQSSSIVSVELKGGQIITEGPVIDCLKNDLLKSEVHTFVEKMLSYYSAVTPVEQALLLAKQFDECSKINTELTQIASTHGSQIVLCIQLFLHFFEKGDVRRCSIYRIKSLDQLGKMYARLDEIQSKIKKKKKEILLPFIAKIVRHVVDIITCICTKGISFTHEKIFFIVTDITAESRLRRTISILNTEVQKMKDPVDQMKNNLENINKMAERKTPYSDAIALDLFTLRKQNNVLQEILQARGIEVSSIQSIIEEADILDEEKKK